MKNNFLLMISIASVSPVFASSEIHQAIDSERATLQVELGRALFMDPILSKNKSQSCATCHNPQHGFIDNRDNGVNGAASLGDDGRSLGNRNAPTASYAAFSPVFHYDTKNKQYIGGQFHDGRKKDLQGQAGGPPLNQIEMGMKDKSSVVQRLQNHPLYSEQLKRIYGDNIFSSADNAYAAMTESIAVFEKTDFFSPFDSKYDRYLQGKYILTDQEELGYSLFFSNNNTNCSTCHKLKQEGHRKETFSNYEYHNIGVPVNKSVQSKNGLPGNWIDHGLLNNPLVSDSSHDGKYKVPTLRNIAITGPYMHNGVFQNLKTTIAFYDKYNNPKRNINPETNNPWNKAEIEETVNLKDLKMKKLSDAKINALVAFLKTLTDKRYEHFQQ